MGKRMICKHCNKQYDDKLEWCSGCQEPNPNKIMPFRVQITKWDTVNVTVGEYLRSLEEESKGKSHD